jgi:hypothetical protein
LLLIARLSLDAEWNVLLGQRLQRGFGDQVFPALEDSAREATQQERERLFLRASILESDFHHGVYPSGLIGTFKQPARNGV